MISLIIWRHKTYAASNGLASGTSYEEAVIHGAMEVMERDAHSYFLIDTFVLNKSPRVLDFKTLPKDIKKLVRKIERQYQNSVVILELPSRFGVSAYMAFFLNADFEINPRGCGASLNAHYALERSIYELVQLYNLNHGHYLNGNIEQSLLKNNRLIETILRFDLSSVFEKNT